MPDVIYKYDTTDYKVQGSSLKKKVSLYSLKIKLLRKSSLWQMMSGTNGLDHFFTSVTHFTEKRSNQL